MALAVDSNRASFKIVRLRNNNFEILCCVGKIPESKRRIVVFTIYIPPKTDNETFDRLGSFLTDSIEHVMDLYRNPFCIITGDFNKRDITPYLADFPELKLIRTPPTRGNNTLDLIFTNIEVSEARILPPLESNSGLMTSDHCIISIRTKPLSTAHFTKKVIKFRPFTERGKIAFENFMLACDWNNLTQMSTDDAAENLRIRLDAAVNEFFPEKSRIIKSSDPPWMNKSVKTMLRRKRREYRRARRSPRWKVLNIITQRLIDNRKLFFFDDVKDKLLQSKNSAAYFKAVKLLGNRDESGTPWTIQEMFPGIPDQEIAEKLAEYFNTISQEFVPLDRRPSDSAVDMTPRLHEISSRLRHFKKTNSRVPGDVFKQLTSEYSDLFAIPLEIIYSKCFTNAEWPQLWKNETVTVIPKCSRPSELSELRNLSCTPLFSKVMESFILEKLKNEAPLGDNQFGGRKGSSVDHFLVESWDCILRAIEDPNAAISLASIDFEKAFNRMCHHQCIASAEALGASSSTVAMIRAFLTGRKMTVKVGDARSSPRNVNGGSPQGSILANYLFCLVTEQFGSPPGERPARDALEANLSGNSHHSGDRPDPSPSDVEPGSGSDEDEIRAGDFLYFRPLRRINDSVLSNRAPQEEIDIAFGLPDNWIDKPLQVKAYIDDLNCIEKIKTPNSVCIISEDKRILKVHSPEIEIMFEFLFGRASEIGMRVNQKKTQLLCISAAVNENISSYIRPLTNGSVQETSSGRNLKILGFWFNERPTVHLHIKIMSEKFRAKLWSLRQLKLVGISSADLLKVYLTVIRPIIEFAAVTYGPMLTSELSDCIERLQLRVMKIIFGLTVSYRSVLETLQIKTLKERRHDLLCKFAEKTVKNPRFSSKWFPLSNASQHNTRFKKRYLEEKSRTDRLYKSPLFTMRRILNLKSL